MASKDGGLKCRYRKLLTGDENVCWMSAFSLKDASIDCNADSYRHKFKYVKSS